MPVFEQVLEKYPQDVKLVFKNFPLRNHKFAEKAAIAALAAGEQGKFWEFHDLLFKNYNKLSDQKIQEIAQAVGITERAVQRILGELEAAGVISRTRQGRRTHYEINDQLPLRHPIEADHSIGELMRLATLNEL